MAQNGIAYAPGIGAPGKVKWRLFFKDPHAAYLETIGDRRRHHRT